MVSMTHCELWLESKDGVKQIRVALMLPEGWEYPEGFEKTDVETQSKKTLYVTEWFDGIVKAKKTIDAAAKFYSDRDLRFLYYREIRKPAQ